MTDIAKKADHDEANLLWYAVIANANKTAANRMKAISKSNFSQCEKGHN